MCLCQSFEGQITYENSYTSKVPNITSEQFNVMMGTTQKYYIKGGKYKSITNGSFSKMQIYVPSENRLYNKLATSDTLIWSDVNINSDEAVDHEVKKDRAEILGYKCYTLMVRTKTGKAIYYFNKKIAVDPNLYKIHKYGNWDLILSLTKSLPLKIEMETQQFTFVSTAVEIKDMELEDSFFDLPEEVPIKRSSY